ncbi:MAG: glycosyltransferase [Muribaculum sp.]|nr:glycosyltransferase [Muribaculaceae bacterium]MCM1080869.1 glycosyltransferase [Muribaculum sp.]
MLLILPNILLAIAVISAVAALAIQVPRLYAILKQSQHDNSSSSAINYDSLPGVSVIVYTHNSTAGLERQIPQLMSQKYPDNKFEVIVVNDGANPTTESLLLMFESEWSNRLRHTFTPADTRGISSKNLALMLGIKSAQFPIILHTNSDTSINSDYWAANMVRPFADNPEVQVVLGCGVLAAGKTMRQRIYLMDTVNYLASAINGRPWRGDGSNLAYSRRLFFDNKGFSSLLNLRYGGGDDDAFISLVANAKNCSVSINRDAIVTIQPDDPVSHWRNMSRRRRWAARQCRNTARVMQAITSALLWVSLLTSLLSIPFMLQQPTMILAPVCVQLLLWTALSVLWRKVSIALGAPKFSFSVCPVMLLRPLRTIYHLIFG